MKVPPTLTTRITGPDQGFTLIELLMTMIVAGILVAIAVPAFNNFVQNDRDSTQINSLVYSFNYARSEAVKRNTPGGVKVCPSANAAAGALATCDPNPAAVWSEGWIVYDVASAQALQSVPKLAGANVLSAVGGGAAGITFKSSGGTATTPTTKIKICDIRGSAYALDVEVSPVGNIATSQKPGQDALGAALACP
jgi:type IV fimbrial biogenesis protein FimT